MKILRAFLITLICCVVPVSRAVSQVHISGFLRGVLPDTTYIVDDLIQVAVDDSVWIEPGAEFLFDGSYNFEIYGYFYAVGSESDSIVFRPNDGIESFGSIIFQQGSSNESELSYAYITGASGSAVNAYYVTITISHCTVVNNQANWGGGIYFSHADGVISDCVVTDNECVNNGGGIYCTGASPTIENCTVLRNRSNIGGTGSGRGGGGITANHSSSPRILNCTIEDNYCTENGGGISINDNSQVIISGCEINDNDADSSGGGIFCSANSYPVFSNIHISGNTALHGGGIYLVQNADADLDSVNIIANSADGQGGGISCEGSSPELAHCEIVDNSADLGGGIYVSNSDSLAVVNCTISANSAWTDGGGLYVASTSGQLLNTIVEGSTGNGGLFFAPADTFLIHYCDFYGNENDDFTGEVPPDLGIISGTNANGDPCDLFFNIFADPLFSDPAGLDFHLQEGSPCIDAGDPTSPHDPDGSVADIGVYYFDQLAVSYQNERQPDVFPQVSNYPNPFNPATIIRFNLPQAAKVTLAVFDINGRLISSGSGAPNRAQATPTTEYFPPGTHEITFDGSGLPSGVYVYRLTAGDYTASGKMLLLK